MTAQPDPTRLVVGQREAAAMLDISTKTLLAEVMAGRIRFLLIGSTRKFAISDINEYIQRRIVECQRGATVNLLLPKINPVRDQR